MNKLCDTLEPVVIDEKLIQEAIEQQGPQKEAGEIAKAEGIAWKDVEAVCLEFKNILKIHNLQNLTSLTTLQMDNNIIERIEGLDNLVNLKFLDLSFNNIEEIAGLDKLANLEQLSLFQNKISTLENIEMLKKLQVFCVGNNNIQDRKNIVYLRQFLELRSLGIAGNPLCQEADFWGYVTAYLPTLRYLEYRLVRPEVKEEFTEKYKYDLMKLTSSEEKTRQKEAEDAQQQLEKQRHEAAFVEELDGTQLFCYLFHEDPEGNLLLEVPGTQEIHEQFKEQMVLVCRELFQTGLTHHEKRELEMTQFYTCMDEAKTHNQEQGAHYVEEFILYKEKIFPRMLDLADLLERGEGSTEETEGAIQTLMTEFNSRSKELWEKLMALEMLLVDQLEESINQFERNLTDMVNSFVEASQVQFSQCRELEGQYNERMLEICLQTLDRALKSDEDLVLSEDTKLLFLDKDTITSALSASHDAHLLAIDSREDMLVSRINSWLVSKLKDIHKSEETRNRNKVTEINRFTDRQRDELEELELLSYQTYAGEDLLSP